MKTTQEEFSAAVKKVEAAVSSLNAALGEANVLDIGFRLVEHRHIRLGTTGMFVLDVTSHDAKPAEPRLIALARAE